jgi:L-ascorbate metabolism protein UlaG (beta-lactamase superfamily)
MRLHGTTISRKESFVDIQFLNHASVKIVTAGARVTSDPWYLGSAFNNGWDLIHQDQSLSALAGDSSHIWISHEHPDHFSIPFFKSAPHESVRILFQKTADHRVAKFLRGQGFTVEEIGEGQVFPLAAGESFRVGRSGFYDSWSLLRAEGRSVFNLNDCDISSEQELRKLAAAVGPIDVLLTQFSYAAWKGGRANRALRELAAQNKLVTIQRQIACLKPKYVIPFASFVYFSHAENDYLNDSVNDVVKAAEAIRAAGSIPIIMKPRDVWTVGNDWNNAEAIAYWQAAYRGLAALPRHAASKTVPLADLVVDGEKYRTRVFAKNNRAMMRLAAAMPAIDAFRPLAIRLADSGDVVRFSFFEPLRELPRETQADVEMSSESLDFIFLNEFGYDTLTVNGRFEASTQGFARMTKNFAVGSLNALGLNLGLSLMARADVLLLLLGKLRSFLRKMNDPAPAKG